MPRPKKIASNQARELPKKDSSGDGAETGVGSPERRPHQTSNATSVSADQIARPTRQLPVRSITRGAKDAAMAAPPMIEVT
ncbi:hypothetical protein D3C72_2265100 [compost metagenome]